jgi:putative two-component system response regulator
MAIEVEQSPIPVKTDGGMDMEKSSKPTILIVDDEAGPREALRMILGRQFNLKMAETAEAALQMLREQTIDLVTLDLRLPDGWGTEVLREIKQEMRGVLVIIITGYGTLEAALDGIESGADAYLHKPFDAKEVIGTITQLLNHSRVSPALVPQETL